MFDLLLIRDTFKAIRRMMETAYLYNVGISYEEYTVKVLGTAQLLKGFTHKHGDPSLLCNTHFGCCFVLFLKPSVITRRLGRQTGKFKSN